MHIHTNKHTRTRMHAHCKKYETISHLPLLGDELPSLPEVIFDESTHKRKRFRKLSWMSSGQYTQYHYVHLKITRSFFLVCSTCFKFFSKQESKRLNFHFHRTETERCRMSSRLYWTKGWCHHDYWTEGWFHLKGWCHHDYTGPRDDVIITTGPRDDFILRDDVIMTNGPRDDVIMTTGPWDDFILRDDVIITTGPRDDLIWKDGVIITNNTPAGTGDSIVGAAFIPLVVPGAWVVRSELSVVAVVGIGQTGSAMYSAWFTS